MIYKSIIAIILVFWATMTVWLFTSTYYPEFERLPEVEPALILNKFLENDEVTHLFVYEGENEKRSLETGTFFYENLKKTLLEESRRVCNHLNRNYCLIEILCNGKIVKPF